MSEKSFTPTPHTTLKRLPLRGSYEKEVIYRILDEGFVCHVGFAVEGCPFVIPTGYARIGDLIYLHGSAASRMLRALAKGVHVCVTVTLVDALVLARSAFHHSMNYRSVTIFGTASVVEDRITKLEALQAFSEHVVPGRWDEVRQPSEDELRKTLVLSLPMSEVSAKIRHGEPVDDEPDYELPVWAGELPLNFVPGTPVPDPRLPATVKVPSYLRNYSRGKGRPG